MTSEQNIGNEDLVKKADLWRERCDERLDQFLNSNQVNRLPLIDILLEEGVLGRIAPLDAEERAARVALGKTVWEGSRDDPELYWRILYSAASAKNAAEKRYTFVADSRSYILGALSKLYQITSSPKARELFPEAYDEKTRKDFEVILAEEIIERVKQELKKRGIEPPEKLISYGARGRWKGLDVVVENVVGDGLIWLKGETEEDHRRLYEFTHGRGVSPSQINAKNFEETVEAQ